MINDIEYVRLDISKISWQVIQTCLIILSFVEGERVIDKVFGGT